MSSPSWQPANETERKMTLAFAAGDVARYLRIMVAAELYLPQVPREGITLREGAEEWVPVTRQVGDHLAVPVFTSLAGMGSAIVVHRYGVTSFAEVRNNGPGRTCGWLSISASPPRPAYRSTRSTS